MKELVGKIYRDEDGIETIERCHMPATDWEVIIFDTPNKVKTDLHYGYKMTCPYCGNSISCWVDSIAARDKSIKNSMFAVKHTYCGFCGHRNIH